MKSKLKDLLHLLGVFASVSVASATDVPAQPIAKKGTLVFADDFERSDLGAKWRVTTPTFVIGDEMRASLDGKAVGYLKSSGSASPARTSSNCPMAGSSPEPALMGKRAPTTVCYSPR